MTSFKKQFREEFVMNALIFREDIEIFVENYISTYYISKKKVREKLNGLTKNIEHTSLNSNEKLYLYDKITKFEEDLK